MRPKLTAFIGVVLTITGAAAAMTSSTMRQAPQTARQTPVKPPVRAAVAVPPSAATTPARATAKLDPNPGTRAFQRLNRAEYKAAVKDLVGLDIDPGNWLPLDTMSGNFDNIADAQFLNPTVLEAYLNAAEDISRMAVGDRNAPDISVK